MENPLQWQFADFCLDAINACLRHKERMVKLKPKTVDVLRYLLERSGRLVTKGELFAALWRETAVSDGVLTTSINELRTALTDDAKTPRFIETVHRRGYRFIASVTTVPSSVQGVTSIVQNAAEGKHISGGNGQRGTWETEDVRLETDLSLLHNSLRRPNAANVVGRDAELAHLHKLFAQALSGARQIVFLTGEPGIGKSRLVEAFLATIPSREALWIGHGQCIDQYGGGEAYLPVLEALGRLGRGPHGAQLTALLRQHAPMWLMQLSALLTPTEREMLTRQVMDGTRERMLRELSETLEALTVTSPLVLVLEDLHWSDLSTLELLAALARRRESARLLIVGTYRPVDVIVRAHPVNAVKQELQVHGLCQEVALPYLSATAVAAYLAQRFAHNCFPPDLATVLFQHTEGNPLFMVNIVDHWITQGALTQVDGTWMLQYPLARLASIAPPSLTQFVEQQIGHLGAAAQELLGAASVMGGQFSVAALASAVGHAATDVEEQCERLSNLQKVS